jgi:polyketide synthase PksN
MHLSHRLSCVARSGAELVQLLGQWLETGGAGQVFTGELPEGRVREQAALKKFGNYCIRECREATDAASYVESLSAIADLYVQGYALDFDGLFAGDVRRMPLPTYPFARERHWVGGVAEPLVPQVDVYESTASAVWVFSKDGAGLPLSAADKMELFLKQETARQLQVPTEAIPGNQSYFDLGLTSLAIAHLIRDLNQLLDEELSPSALFEYTDIQSLAGYLAAAYGAKIDVLAVTRIGAHPVEHAPLHPAKLPVLAATPELTPAQLLEEVLWQDELIDDDYEKVTF